ncbi:uncharacterized protein FOMMEDRAFT_167526 [Fomitiporia mediterranea MF3/22]|uniref:uncharacterized protein n=1 Tax=Fomitiporia mediterranea (strain MF3/22) TaxID=694068 RepID=UPI00044077DE|nr:uncharacterized protein FOMMEDRAFT_167526 [Fomitiporia mediterranea MF3/22]EJD04314.1 hypothetical protein FOMMEDRAFT_167526 [Fomitiporia mediterranea MF3/22]
MGKHDLDASDDDSTEPPGDQDFLVEVITKARVAGYGIFEYRVKWFDYTSDDDTWEPEENVAECTRLLKNFWKEVGKHNKKKPGPQGTEYSASDQWIKNERRHFRKEMEAEKAANLAKRKEKEQSKKTKVPKVTKEGDAPTTSRAAKEADILKLFPDAGSDSEDDAPTMSKPRAGKQADVSKQIPRVTSDSEDSDSVPLSVQVKSVPKVKQASRPTPAPSKVTKVKLKVNPPQRPTLQTSSTAPNKYSGMKISKKHAEATRPSPVNSPTVPPGDAPPIPKPRGSIPTPRSSIHSLASPREPPTDSSKQFLPPRPRPSIPTPTPTPAPPADNPPVSLEDADNFLATTLTFDQVRSQKPENLASTPTMTTTAIPPNVKFTKKWSWSGELFFDTCNAAEKLCNVTIHDPCETSEIGFRLNQVLDSKDSLRFSKAYRQPELNIILRGLKKMDQIAKISQRAEGDKDALAVFMKFLERRRLVGSIKLSYRSHLNNDSQIISSAFMTSYGHVAEVIVFPSTDKDMCERLDLSLRYKSADCLLLALMPWHIPPSKYNILYLKPDELRDSEFEKELDLIRRDYPLVTSRPGLEDAFRILGFDLSFVKFLPSRDYCIWTHQVESRPIQRGRRIPGMRPETKALLDVLSFFKANNVGYDILDARIVFVHVGSVRSIRKLPGITQRRFETPEVRFVTYGSHENVKPSLWGFREIYPLGGIVTFTATALLENPLRVAELIEHINRHRLWQCYMLPSVLAVFVRLSCPGEDPSSVYAREPFFFSRILDLIEDGKVALMNSPSSSKVPPFEDEGEDNRWIIAQHATLSKSSLQLLEECYTTFVSDYSNKADTELGPTIEAEIVEDLAQLQTQQIVRERYRRFVVIKSSQDTHIEVNKDGFEWRTAEEFSFGDGFPVKGVDSARATPEPT